MDSAAVALKQLLPQSKHWQWNSRATLETAQLRLLLPEVARTFEINPNVLHHPG